MTRIRQLATLAALCALATASLAQPASVIELVTSEVAGERAARLGLLKRLTAATGDVLANSEAKVRGDVRNVEGANLLELMGTLQSQVGDVDGAINSFDQRQRKRVPQPPQLSPVSQEALEGLHAEEAVKAIVEAAKDRRVVLVNEAHHVPLHRAFTMKLARALRKEGFSYFAAETLSRDGVGMAGAEVARRDGAYIEEPSYAELLRDVGRNGWQVVAYEHMAPPEGEHTPAQRLQHRETMQALNLVQKVLKRDPTSRLLVHVGYMHLAKVPIGSGLKLMGAMLRELSGVDPLTVDQTVLYAHPDPAMEPGPYRQLVNSKNIRVASVLKKGDGTPFILGLRSGTLDLQVIHPPYGVSNGRPDWLASVAGREPVDIPKTLLPVAKPRLVLAFHAQDRSADAVPADAVLLQPGQLPSSLMLPPGRFTLEVEELDRK